MPTPRWEFGRKDEKSDQGGRIEAAKLGSWEATELGIGKAGKGKPGIPSRLGVPAFLFFGNSSPPR